jgi:5-methylcytosine-specific restriction endonuclease McrA
MPRPYLAFYGTKMLTRGVCPACGETALVISGHYACCEAPLQETPRGYVRISTTAGRRQPPPKRDRDRILREQGYSCLYCMGRFGTRVYRKAKELRLRVNWDHLVPWSLTQDNRPKNYVAACQVCNGIKADHIFATVSEARAYVAVQAQKKGYSFSPLRLLRTEVSDVEPQG